MTKHFLTSRIEEGAPLSSKFFNKRFDEVDETLQEFEDNIAGPWRGDWDSSVEYDKNDIVKGQDGNVYIALKENIDQPPYQDDYNEYWKILINEPFRWHGDWDSQEQYYEGDIVKGQDGNVYIALKENIDQPPYQDDSNEYWKILINEPFRWEGDWDESKSYYEGDIVKGQDGNVYIALKENTDQPPYQDDYNEYWKILINEPFRWHGDWDERKSYYEGDVVRALDGNIYVANEFTDSNPSLNYGNFEPWDLLIPSIKWKGIWDSQEQYYKGDIVRGIDHNTYIALKSNIDSEPKEECLNDDSGDWQLLNFSFGRWKSEWAEDTFYQTNDIVKGYDNNLYIAKTSNINENPPDSEEYWEIFLYGSDQADDRNAIKIQGQNVSQQDPEGSEALVFNSESNKYELEKVYNQKEIEQKAQTIAEEQSFLTHVLFEQKSEIKGNDITEIRVVTEDEYPDDPEDTVLYIVVED